MTRKALDPNLASILDSIRATVGGEVPPTVHAPEPSDEFGPHDEDAPTSALPSKAGKKAVAAPSIASQRTVEEFLSELIRPQVEAWLNANLPELVQKMAADEIARLTSRK